MGDRLVIPTSLYTGTKAWQLWLRAGPRGLSVGPCSQAVPPDGTSSAVLVSGAFDSVQSGPRRACRCCDAPGSTRARPALWPPRCPRRSPGSWLGAAVLMQLAVYRVQQGHVLRPFEGQLLGGVVMHHLGDAAEDAAGLAQRVLVVLGLGHEDVDTSLTGPAAKPRVGGRSTLPVGSDRSRGPWALRATVLALAPPVPGPPSTSGMKPRKARAASLSPLCRGETEAQGSWASAS